MWHNDAPVAIFKAVDLETCIGCVTMPTLESWNDQVHSSTASRGSGMMST